MSVTRVCEVETAATELSVSTGEYLEYETEADSGVTYVLTEDDQRLFDTLSCPSTCKYHWTKERPSPSEVVLTLGMQFFGNGSLNLVIRKLTAGGKQIAVLKSCSYKNTDAQGAYYDSLEVFLS